MAARTRVTSGLFAVLLVLMSPQVEAAQIAGSVDSSAAELPVGFKGATIQQLLEASSPTREGESGESSEARTRIEESDGPVLIDLNSAEAGCRATWSYDKAKAEWVVTLVYLAGIVDFECSKRGLGVSIIGPDVDNIVRIPMSASDAGRLGPGLRLWLAVRRGNKEGEGLLYRPFGTNGPTGIYARTLSLWMTDASSRVIAKVALRTRPELAQTVQPVRSGTQSPSGQLQIHEAADPKTTKQPLKDWRAACQRADRATYLRGYMSEDVLQDLKFQLEGLQANGGEVGVSFDQYVARSIEKSCNSNEGWQFTYGRFTIDVPGQMGCLSAGSGEGHHADCDFRTSVPAPEGFQICKFTYVQDQRRHGKFEMETRRFAGDPPNGRVRSLDYHFTGRGDQGNASYVIFRNIKITILAAEIASTEERRKAGCDYLEADRPKPIPIPQAPTSHTVPNPQKTPADIRVSLVDKRGDGVTLLFVNYGQTVGVRCGEVFVTRDNGTERVAWYGCQGVDPGANVTFPLHEWGQRGWRLVFQ